MLFLFHYLQLTDGSLSRGVPLMLLRACYSYAQNKKLTGEIPAELWTLSQLKSVKLSNNQLEGVLPPAIGNLVNVEDM